MGEFELTCDFGGVAVGGVSMPYIILNEDIRLAEFSIFDAA